MRRTYRSKKEIGGVIDPREVGASFDAFYIQNIKQSKREMSVGFGASTFASNKVRKRKYVKRLKEQSPMANAPKTEGCISKSEYLTPDKSIHLKRELDPFDLLLNVSASNKESLQAANNGFTPVPTRGKRKPTYKKARKAYTKKINYSCETDSGDENSYDTGKRGIIHDQSDILSHKLEIEKDKRVPFNNTDQSINNIDLSLLKSIASPLASTREDKLSMCIKSPLCSTPFHKKYRGESIFIFSPICVELDGNRHCNTITEKYDEINMAESKINGSNDQHSTVSEELKKSKLNCKNDECDLKGICDQKSIDYDELNSPILPSKYNTNKNKSKDLAMPKHPLSKNKEISSLQTSEEELFLGFPRTISDSENINLKNVINKLVEIKENTFEGVQEELEFNKTSKSFMKNSNDKYCSKEDMNISKPATTTNENNSTIEKCLEQLKSQQQKPDQYAGDTAVQNNDKDVNLIIQYDEKELSITNEMIVERRQISYSEENGIDANKLNISLNEENTCKAIKEKCFVKSELSMNEEDPSEISQIHSDECSLDENIDNVSGNEENTCKEITEICFVKSELSLNEEDPSETSQIHSDENSLDENIDNVSGTSQIYSEENSIVENEKHSSLTCSEGNRENERSSVDRDNIFNDSLGSGSLYESCNSENEMSHFEINSKKPLVVTERLNDSVFNRCYKKDTDPDSIYSSESDEGNEKSFSSNLCKNKNTSIKDNIMSFSESGESSSDDFPDSIVPEIYNKSYFSDFGSNRNTTIKNSYSFSDSFKSTDEDFENNMKENTMMNINTDHENNENDKSDEDVFVSFVTTRRRNEVTKDSFKLSFDNPRTSTSSVDLDETVLSNNKRSIDSLEESDDLTLIGDAKFNNDIVASPICDDELFRKDNSVMLSDIQLEKSFSPEIKRISTSVRKSMTTRKSAKLSTENRDEKSINKKNEKKEAVKSRKSTKKLSTNINRESISKETDLNSRSSVVNRRSIKHYTDIKSVSISEEDDDNITRTRVVPHSKNIDWDSFTVLRESIDRKPMVTAQKVSSQECDAMACSKAYMSTSEIKAGIVLEPGKRWERSLSIYRRVTAMGDLNQSILDETLNTKGRKYRQSVINTMEMQDVSVSVHNESIRSHRSILFTKPSRSTIKIVREPNTSRYSLCSTSSISEDLGFLTEDCDDTLVELSKLSISEHEVTVLDKFNETSSRITTARDYVLRRCNQTDVVLFDECYPDTALKNCRKIGEGVYGEVFLWRAGDGRARVLKIVPIAGDTKVNGESQKDYHEIISEIVIAMELSALRAPITDIEKHLDEGKGVETLDLHSVENATDVFNEVLAVRCVYGSYPSRLLDLWELYDECTGSDNDNPAILPAEQQFMVLELANAGQDLESYQFHNAEQAFALFQQVAFGLAVAEEAFQFEHRDLHWGNVLIAPTEQKYATFVLRGRTHRVPRRGVAATIIDYSLSRLSLRLPSADSAALYNDLAADDGLFDAVGDYQFEVYRLMRDKLGNDWKNFEPYTNILWLHYTVDKMITALRYTRTNTKIHKHYIAKLKDIKNRILEYGSAVQYVLTDNEL